MSFQGLSLEPLTDTGTPWNAADGTHYVYVGQYQKATENDFSIPIIQMGARVYLPTIGRFAQVDPIEGGVDNNYVYPTDPVNSYDLTGEFVWFAPVAWFVARTVITHVVRKAVARKAGVYIARTTSKKLYVGQTNNFARRAYQHARTGKIAHSSPRIKIPVKSKANRNRVEKCIYYCIGTKKAPWVANKIKPPRNR
jgi:RHS repeat-associated protein